jgi:FlaA1/EpsC-like NDP-sugar epimerase
MSYGQRLSLLLFIDSVIVLTSIYVSNFVLVFNDTAFSTPIMVSSITLLFSHHIFAQIFKLYNRAWEYASVGELVAIVRSVTLSILVTALVQLIVFHNIYYRALAITWMMHILLIGGSRFFWRVYRDSYMKPLSDRKRTLIIGAGAAGNVVVRQLLNRNSELIPVAFIDDDKKKQHLQVMGITVYGGTSQIESAVKDLDIEHIVIAIPSLKTSELNSIYLECSKTEVKTQILPKIEDLMIGKVSISNFRDVQVEDLLGRDPVELDMKSISDYLSGKVILVTGAGGSIGSEICRQVSRFNPKKLLLLGHGENSIYQIDIELRNKYQTQFEIVPIIADVQDRNRIFEVMETHQPNVVYHAAAHKHVPLMEYNPKEAVKNNVIGTKNVAEAADRFGVKAFVMVSSDKAVNPTNVMGATKRMAEMVVQQMDKQSQTKFVAVRFGNVLGSRGSVIPLFKKQIKAGGPITVTHPDMTRYFMTIPEASRLVIQAGTLARGGEIFVLDMGEPVRIVDLAKNLIRLSGYKEDEIDIQYTGLRPGEKMFEELLNENEIHKEPVFPKIFIGRSVNLYMEEVNDIILYYNEVNEKELKQRVLDLANNRVGKKKSVSVLN